MNKFIKDKSVSDSVYLVHLPSVTEKQKESIITSVRNYRNGYNEETISKFLNKCKPSDLSYVILFEVGNISTPVGIISLNQTSDHVYSLTFLSFSDDIIYKTVAIELMIKNFEQYNKGKWIETSVQDVMQAKPILNTLSKLGFALQEKEIDRLWGEIYLKYVKKVL